MTTETTKVGNIPSPEKKERNKKPKFDLALAVDAAGVKIPHDDKGRLTAIPANVPSESSNLSKGDFESVAMYFDYKAFSMDYIIASATERKAEWMERAEEERSDKPSRKRQIKKVAKLKSQMEELMALLEADGLSKEELATMLAD